MAQIGGCWGSSLMHQSGRSYLSIRVEGICGKFLINIQFADIFIRLYRNVLLIGNIAQKVQRFLFGLRAMLIRTASHFKRHTRCDS